MPRSLFDKADSIAMHGSSGAADVAARGLFPVKPGVTRHLTSAACSAQCRSSTHDISHERENHMSNEFSGTGNAGDDAALKTVIVANEEKRIAELHVYFDEHSSPQPSEAARDRGFWLDVTVWGDRQAAEVAQHVKKGARVHVVGRLAEHRWTVTATGEERSAMHLNAERVYLALTRVAEVRFNSARRSGANG